MSYSEPDRIVVRGKDLTGELMGRIDFGSFLFLEIVGRLPTDSEATLVNAILVALAEHGINPTSLSARLTYFGAPRSIQGAIAAGILGAGEVLLGAVEATAELLQAIVQSEDPDAELTKRVERFKASGQRVPGLGHHLHRPSDPRTDLLFRLAEEGGFDSRHRRTMESLRLVAEKSYGKNFPINADGAIGAVLSDMGFDWRITRGFAIVARAGGLLGHIADEIRQPIARDVWTLAENGVQYEDPEPAF